MYAYAHYFPDVGWRVMCQPLDFEGSMTPEQAREATEKVNRVAAEVERLNKELKK